MYTGAFKEDIYVRLGLENRKALITGASRGIGQAIFSQLNSEGCHVVGLSRSHIEFDEVKPELKNDFYIVDLMNDKERESCMSFLKEKYGYFDIIVNNVGGTLDENNPLSDLSVYEKVMKYNFGITVDLNAMFIPSMISNNWGRICNISSISALENQGPPAYSAAKAALNAYTRGVGRFLAHKNIVMTSVMPGAVLTKGGYWDLMRRENPEKLEEYLRNRMAIGRLGTVEEIANLVTFLVSEHSSFMVGSNILVDGGQGRVFHHY